MQVGLDLSFRNRSFSGIGAYSTSLAMALQAIDDLEIVPIAPGPSHILKRFGVRAERFAWEWAGAGLTCRRQGVDLLHMPFMAVPILAGVPVIATVHDVIPYVLPAYRQSWAMRLNLAVARRRLQSAAAIITPSRHARTDVIEILGIPADRIHVIAEAAGAAFHPSSDPKAGRAIRAKYQLGDRYIFNVGGFDERKNLPLLCRAFAALLPLLPFSVDLIIAGAPHSTNPNVFPPLEPVIAELGIADRIRLPGRISETDKIALLQHAAIYVSPSRYEGFGLTFLEAMACGAPVIGLRRTSIPEVIREAGILVEPEVESLAHAMRMLITEPEAAAHFRQLGIDRAASFSWAQAADETAALYRDVLTISGKGRN
jgi:glycosyltransferase involved in cell wall biosynthesis